ncbi:MAG: tetratricopeptide repeat protein, partial [Candidatus Eisenbacteria bacterium]|nr:tetratricopeptide repeat protein [Candidatus Eisenbacteria bacterium]
TPGSGGSGGNGHEPRGGVFDLRPVADAALDPAAIEPAAIDPAARSAGDAETRTERERIERLLEERDFSLATDLLLRLHEEQPEQSWIVEKLIAAARGQGDRLAAVRYLTLLGDLRINEEDLEGSLDCFLQVLDIERENATACRRLARFREMRVRGWERIPDTVEGEASPPPRRVPLTVLEQEGTGGPEWVDLSTLLEEFRAGVRSQFRPDDVEGHYDLGVSHQEMGLYEEAIEEFDFVLAVPSLPPGRAAQAREMRGICLERLGRTEEASSEYRRILGQDPAESPNAAGVRYRLACLLEASGEIEEARQLFRALSIEHAAFPDLEERLQRLGG